MPNISPVSTSFSSDDGTGQLKTKQTHPCAPAASAAPGPEDPYPSLDRRPPTPASASTSPSTSSSTLGSIQQEVLRLVQDDLTGALPASQPHWNKFRLGRPEYRRLVRLLERHPRLEHHWQTRLRKDYDCERGELVLRLMPTPLHDYFKSGLADELKRVLDEAAARHPATTLPEVRHKIRYGDSGDITRLSGRHGDVSKRSPDSQYCFVGTRLPVFIVEVGYSQKSRDLQQLARSYIESSGGKIKTVLTVDIEYSPPKRRRSSVSRTAATAVPAAAVSLYRMGSRPMHNVVFRDQGGTWLPGAVELRLDDFVPQGYEVATSVAETALTIGFDCLNRTLADAEQRQRDAEQSPTPEPGVEAEATAGKKRTRVEFDWDLSSEDEEEEEEEQESQGQEEQQGGEADNDDDDGVGRDNSQDNKGDDGPELQRPQTRSTSRSSRFKRPRIGRRQRASRDQSARSTAGG